MAEIHTPDEHIAVADLDAMVDVTLALVDAAAAVGAVNGQRLLRALPWAGLALAILIFYWVEASLRKTPWLFTDELEWTQLSRAIASTGHAARRGQPHSFESLYSFLIAPAWWIHSTAAAYAAIKYLNAVVMCLAARPAYLLARMLLARGAPRVVVALLSIAIPAMSYATSIVPEPLAYLWFTTAALAALRALASRRPWPVARGRCSLAAGGVLVRLEFVVLPASLVLAAAVRGRSDGNFSWRRVLLGGRAASPPFGLLFNVLVVERVQSWTFGAVLQPRTRSPRAASRRRARRSGSACCR